MAWNIAITSSEWLNWIAHGRLRTSLSRVSAVEGADDLAGFRRLLGSAPDVVYGDEQALVIATLRDRWLCDSEHRTELGTAEFVYLPLRVVECFVPVSERAARLLAGDAERAQCAFAPPVFESLWMRWTREQEVELQDWCGCAFARVLGLAPTAMTDAIAPEWLQYLRTGRPALSEEKRKHSEGSRGLLLVGDAGRLSVRFIDCPMSRKHELRRSELQEFLKAAARDRSLERPCLTGGPERDMAKALESAVARGAGVEVPFAAFVVIQHHVHCLDRLKDLELASVGHDLGVLRDEFGEAQASVAACYIGRRMEPVAVSTLLYAVTPVEYPAFATEEPRVLMSVRSCHRAPRNWVCVSRLLRRSRRLRARSLQETAKRRSSPCRSRQRRPGNRQSGSLR
jgi:hypothetical protein